MRFDILISVQVLLLAYVGILTVSAQCKLPIPAPFQNLEVICRGCTNNTVPILKEIHVKCKEYYEIRGSRKTVLSLRCLGKHWDKQFKLNEMHCKIKCGQSIKPNRQLLINSTTTDRVFYPWHIAIFKNDAYVCGGTLINPFGNELVVLTAFHCFKTYDGKYDENKDDYKIVVGAVSSSLEKNLVADGAQILLVKQLVGQESYGYTKYTDDIALVQTNKPIQLTQYSQPVCLPTHEIVVDGGHQSTVSAVVIGFGSTDPHEEIPSEKLRRVKVPVLRTQSCFENSEGILEEEIEPIISTQICAGVWNGENTCYGDSGGGLFFQDNYPIKYTIQGIVSSAPLNYKCRGVSVFTKVYPFLDWIERNSDMLLNYPESDPEFNPETPSNTSPTVEVEPEYGVVTVTTPRIHDHTIPLSNFEHLTRLYGCDAEACHEECLTKNGKPGVCAGGFYQTKYEIRCYCDNPPVYSGFIKNIINSLTWNTVNITLISI